MSSNAWGIIGAIVFGSGYQLMQYGFGQTAGYVFVGISVVAYVVSILIYKRQLSKLKGRVANMPEEEKRQFLSKIDPEVANDIRQKKDDADAA